MLGKDEAESINPVKGPTFTNHITVSSTQFDAYIYNYIAIASKPIAIFQRQPNLKQLAKAFIVRAQISFIHIFHMLRMTKNSSASMQRLVLMMGVLALLVSTELAIAVHGRTLRSTTMVVGGCEEQGGRMGVTSFGALSAANHSSNSRNSFRSLGFRLASGPSKRGPGH
ncbi:hypothetical protein Goarm_022813 [Gossypium armourianum]|uniref:Uncharacterized protein n=1 Tax=Gossypium armourianum TaxID=34283 RepID=A0A7J9KEG4_9ROSI|nr:hypothetical protein [Gossypium armourianum]